MHMREQKIAALNDTFRTTGIGGRTMVTSGFNAHPEDWRLSALEAIRTFKDFDKDCDPHHERDFVSVEVNGEKIFWKVDYYDRDIRYLSDDPSDPNITVRVATIMLASEY
jgi:hypothetical protein